jgi:hypothetical protein
MPKVGGPKKLSSVAVQHLLPTDEKPEKLPKSTSTILWELQNCCKICFKGEETTATWHGREAWQG